MELALADFNDPIRGHAVVVQALAQHYGPKRC